MPQIIFPMGINAIVTPFAHSIFFPGLAQGRLVLGISSLSLQKLFGGVGIRTGIPPGAEPVLDEYCAHGGLVLDLAITGLDHDLMTVAEGRVAEGVSLRCCASKISRPVGVLTHKAFGAVPVVHECMTHACFIPEMAKL